MSDKQRFAESMAFTAAAVGKTLDTRTYEVYWQILKDYPIADIEAAFQRLARTSKWFPRVAEIIELITPGEPDLEQIAVAAWDNVFSLLHDSRTAARRCSDPSSAEVVNALGGWTTLGRKSVEELVWVQKEFVRRYVTHQQTKVAPIRRIGHGTAGIGQLLDTSA